MGFTLSALFETPEQEAARLAAAPEGSKNHDLSLLPVTIREWPQDLLIALPGTKHQVVVVPFEFWPDAGTTDEKRPRRRYSGSWVCAVVHSNHPDYPVGGHRILVPAAELARGARASIEGTRPPA
ncbi:hypothetical protein ACFOY4_01315 [Actinomadura syzygii]|uniref:Uncharacterized protein n=1 Tax=Actinomadura syzygii TaxID=1427538 RepID=A0A5D0TQM9_9ACTN|nr:hypothetical protein [Actinomadura syzygii]TYC08611.1 hypothetical protein FXF65_37595 [Actinomadura syzygii]